MLRGRNRSVRRAAIGATIAFLGLLLTWPLVTWRAELRQFVAEVSGYAIRGSVYDPTTGTTIGGYAGSAPDIGLDGVLGHDLVIAQPEGRRISRISRDGEVVWTHETDNWVTGLERTKNALLFSGASSIGALDPADGHALWRRDLASFVSGIGLAADRRLIMAGGRNATIIEAPFRGSAAAGINRPAAIEGAGELANARHAAANGERVIIADTFNHRVIMTRGREGRPAWQIDAFFPNQVLLQPDGSVLVVEEHANRIIRYDPATDKKAVLLSCQHPLFGMLSGPDEIRARQDETGRTPLLGLGARSVCDSRVNPDSLYSPNGFYAAGDSTIYVADTDTHRVAMFDTNTRSVRGTVTGLNNPIRVVALAGAPAGKGK